MIKNMKSLEEGSFVGKKVLIRIDTDVPLSDDRVPKVVDDYRLRILLPTLNFLLNRKASVVLIGHLGRPNGQVDSHLSLRPVYLHLSALLGRPIKFAPNLFSNATKKAVDELEEGELIGLENLRFDKGEEDNSRTFARKLAAYGEIYVNESFATSHRSAASVVAITEFLKPYAGLRFEQEYMTLTDLTRHPAHPFIAVVGGAKAGDKLPVIERLLPKVDRVLVGGRVANNFLAATGVDVDGSPIEASLVLEAKKLIRRGKGKIILPVDFVRREGEILDLGEQTIKHYTRYIRPAKTVLWSGPLGKIEEHEFAKASRVLATAVVDSGATSIAGGGNTTQMLAEFGLLGKFSFVSTGGGATLELLSGLQLPGLKALG